MMWCPNCEVEYREGFTTCADCGAKLKSISNTEIAKPTENDFPYSFAKLIFLIPSPFALLLLYSLLEISVLPVIIIAIILYYFIVSSEKKRFMAVMQKYLGANDVALCNIVDNALRIKGRFFAFYRIDRNIIDEVDLRKPKARNAIYYAERFVNHGWFGLCLMGFICIVIMVVYLTS